MFSVHLLLSLFALIRFHLSWALFSFFCFFTPNSDSRYYFGPQPFITFVPVQPSHPVGIRRFLSFLSLSYLSVHRPVACSVPVSDRPPVSRRAGPPHCLPTRPVFRDLFVAVVRGLFPVRRFLDAGSPLVSTFPSYSSLQIYPHFPPPFLRTPLGIPHVVRAVHRVLGFVFRCPENFVLRVQHRRNLASCNFV